MMEEQADDVIFAFLSDVHLDRPQVRRPSTSHVVCDGNAASLIKDRGFIHNL
jgi:hypothetical protein